VGLSGQLGKPTSKGWQYLSTGGMCMKKLFLQMREAAQSTCGNAYLMDDGSILTNQQYKELSFAEKLRVVMYYKYSTCQIVKI
jgi:hypothetical protein